MCLLLSAWAVSEFSSFVRKRLRRLPPACVLGAVWLSACLPGCVHRRMTIRSNPPGAAVYVDDYEIGTAPVSTDFTYYGTRKIRLVKDGCETLTVMQPIPIPWYQIPPLDFVFENLVPGELRDEHTFTYQLAPQMVAPTDQLLERANDLRRRAHSSGLVRASPDGLGASTAPSATGTYVPPSAEQINPPPGLPEGHAPPSPQQSGGMPLHSLPPGGRPPAGRR